MQAGNRVVDWQLYAEIRLEIFRYGWLNMTYHETVYQDSSALVLWSWLYRALTSSTRSGCTMDPVVV
jgi:hypothetical protein